MEKFQDQFPEFEGDSGDAVTRRFFDLTSREGGGLFFPRPDGFYMLLCVECCH